VEAGSGRRIASCDIKAKKKEKEGGGIGTQSWRVDHTNWGTASHKAEKERSEERREADEGGRAREWMGEHEWKCVGKGLKQEWSLPPGNMHAFDNKRQD
jgi:hypothetical protein